MPAIGSRARISHFGGGFEAATVIGIEQEGRRLEVRCEGGERLVFVLSPASARFIAADRSDGPRLELLDDPA